MKPPVLFLDVDGVLNSRRWFKSRHSLTGAGGPDWHRNVDPEAVATLDRVVRLSDCDLVLSSSWRLAWPLGEISDLLAKLGLSKRLAGKTPTCVLGPNFKGLYVQRGQEIQAWLEEQVGGLPSAIAIVDDDSDMAHLASRLVKTDTEEGLTARHVEPLVALLLDRAPGEAEKP